MLGSPVVPIEHVTQINTGLRNLCGQACAAMIVNAWTGTHYTARQMAERTGTADGSADDLAALWALEGKSLWVGYERGGWSERARVTGETVFYDGMKDGRRWWALVKRGAEYDVVYVFANTERYADANGQHDGQHPCGGWKVGGA